MSLRRSRDLVVPYEPVHESYTPSHRYGDDSNEIRALPDALQGAVEQAVAETLAQLDGLAGVVVQNLNVTVNVGLARGGGATNILGASGTVQTR